MSDIIACRNGPEPKWYEWYRFPLKPSLKIKKADKYNTSGFNFQWLAVHIWTTDSPALGFQLELDDQSIQIRIRLPYLHSGLFFPIFPINYRNNFWRKAKGRWSDE